MLVIESEADPHKKEMEEAIGVGDGGDGTHWWALATAAQLGWGMRSYSKGYAGDSRFMPLKAFAVASLIVGSAASASIVVLQANGIRKVEDLMEAGANLRAKLGLPPRTQNNHHKLDGNSSLSSR